MGLHQPLAVLDHNCSIGGAEPGAQVVLLHRASALDSICFGMRSGQIFNR